MSKPFLWILEFGHHSNDIYTSKVISQTETSEDLYPIQVAGAQGDVFMALWARGSDPPTESFYFMGSSLEPL